MEASTTLARKLNTFVPLSGAELDCLAEMQSRPRHIKRGQQLTQEGQTGQGAFLLLKGWACSYKDLANGGRQIISFPLAGDIVGLRSVLLRTADHSFTTLTDASVSILQAEGLLRCIHEHPRIGSALLWAASRDEAMVVEHLVNIGRRSAVERMAHFYLELAERLNLVGIARGAEFDCPLSQTVLGDALGLTSIHVNRVLRQLREQGLMTVRNGHVRIHDLLRLKMLSGFRGGYLDAKSKLS